MSLIILDIDGFKSINDNYGHNIGDRVIVDVSNMLLKVLRGIDIICRWGGEEFVILLPSVDLNNASHIAEKLRVGIEELHVEPLEMVTASFGVTEVKENDNIKTTVERADKALYLAKSSGKNCVKEIS